MADTVIFIGWGEVIPGREMKSVQVFGEVMQYYTGLQQRGEIESFEAVALDPHGGDLSGFLLVRGDVAALGRLRASEEFNRLNARGQLVVQHFGVVGGLTGEAINNLFQMWQTEAQTIIKD